MLEEKIRSTRTYLNGTSFRSVLECRWSIFFSELGLQWRYEHHRMKVNIGEKQQTYIPDFYLPQLDLAVEVKPHWPDIIAIAKCVAWAEKQPILLLHAYPAIQGPEEEANTLFHKVDGKVVFTNKMRWVACPRCREVGLSNVERTVEISTGKCYYGASEEIPKEAGAAMIKEAYRAAQKATFGRRLNGT